MLAFWKIFRTYLMDDPKNDQRENLSKASISHMKLFAVPLLKKKLNKVVVHVGTNDALHFTLNEMFKNLKNVVF